MHARMMLFLLAFFAIADSARAAERRILIKSGDNPQRVAFRELGNKQDWKWLRFEDNKGKNLGLTNDDGSEPSLAQIKACRTKLRPGHFAVIPERMAGETLPLLPKGKPLAAVCQELKLATEDCRLIARMNRVKLNRPIAAEIRLPAGLMPDKQTPSTPASLEIFFARGKAALIWRPSSDNVSVIGYVVFRDGAEIGKVYAQTHFLDESGQLESGQTYQYEITAFDAQNNYSPPARFRLTTEAPLPSPSWQIFLVIFILSLVLIIAIINFVIINKPRDKRRGAMFQSDWENDRKIPPDLKEIPYLFLKEAIMSAVSGSNQWQDLFFVRVSGGANSVTLRVWPKHNGDFPNTGTHAGNVTMALESFLERHAKGLSVQYCGSSRLCWDTFPPRLLRGIEVRFKKSEMGE